MLFLEECLHCKQQTKTLFCKSCQQLIGFLRPRKSDPDAPENTTLFSRESPIYSLYLQMERGKLCYYLPAMVSLCLWQLYHLYWTITHLYVLEKKPTFFWGKTLLQDLGKGLIRRNILEGTKIKRLWKEPKKKLPAGSSLLLLTKERETGAEKIKENSGIKVYTLQLFHQEL